MGYSKKCKECGHLIKEHEVDYMYKSYCKECDCVI